MKKHEWPKYDPSRGYHLCEACWNYGHFSRRKNEKGRFYLVNMCQKNGCSCPCTGWSDRKRIKFTAQGQEELWPTEKTKTAP